MLRFYIDDGIPGRGHRKNMINPEFTKTGIAHCTHKTLDEMIVVIYGSDTEKIVSKVRAAFDW